MFSSTSKTLSTLLFAISSALCWLSEIPLEFNMLISIVSLVLLWYVMCISKSQVNTIYIYIPVSMLYIFSGVIHLSLGNALEFDPKQMVWLMDVGVLFLGSVVIGWSACAPYVSKKFNGMASRKIVYAALFYCAILLALCLSLALSRYGFNFSETERVDFYANEFVLLSLIRGVLAASFGIVAALIVGFELNENICLKTYKYVLYVLVCLYCIIDIVLFGDRRLPLMAIIPVFIVLNPFKFTFINVIYGSMIFVSLAFYGIVRNYPVSDWLSIIASLDILSMFDPVNYEFGNAAYISNALSGNFSLRSDFPSYLDSFVQLVPKFFNEFRPEAPTQWFARVYYPELHNLGGSFAFNTAIESYLNGDIGMVIFFGFVFGITMNLLTKFRWKGAPVGLAMATYIFSFSMRMDLSSIIRTACIAFGALLSLMIIEFIIKNLTVVRSHKI